MSTSLQWKSLFDLGQCNVAVTLADGTPVCNLPMKKGDSQDVALSTLPAFTLSVAQDGTVSLVFSVDGEGDGAAFSVRVIPQYPHNYPARVRSVASSAAGVDNGDGTAPPFDTDGQTYLAYYAPGSEPDYWPDTFDLSSLGGSRDFVGVTVATIAP